jgi:cytochrome c-type biogenesis protein CcmH/NrfG
MRKRRAAIAITLTVIVVVGWLFHSLYSLQKLKAELAQLAGEKHGLQVRVEHLERDKHRLTRQYEEVEKAKWRTEEQLKRAYRSDTDLLPFASGAAAADVAKPTSSPKESTAPANKR